MKKLLTTITAIIALSVGAVAANAAPPKYKVKKKKKNKPIVVKKYSPAYHSPKTRRNRRKNRRHNRRVVHQYFTHKVVYKWNGRYRNTYLNKVFRNGRTKTNLVKSVRLPRIYPVKVRYKKKVVYLGHHKYLFVYKITKYSNGYKSKVVHKRKRIW